MSDAVVFCSVSALPLPCANWDLNLYALHPPETGRGSLLCEEKDKGVAWKDEKRGEKSLISMSSNCTYMESNKMTDREVKTGVWGKSRIDHEGFGSIWLLSCGFCTSAIDGVLPAKMKRADSCVETSLKTGLSFIRGPSLLCDFCVHALNLPRLSPQAAYLQYHAVGWKLI